VAGGFAYDRKLKERFVIGADEVGRGCLAGPLIACAVVFDQERIGREERRDLERLTDSKRLSSARRAELVPKIHRVACLVVLSSVSHHAIDEHGVEWANRRALRRVLERARAAYAPSFALVDGLGRGLDDVCDRAVKGGDGQSAAIAAASVIAKEARDRLMRRAGERWPEWGYAQHMGYPTKAHRRAIEQHGPSPWQRRSFRA